MIGDFGGNVDGVIWYAFEMTATSRKLSGEW